jgi:hypothetical protein
MTTASHGIGFPAIGRPRADTIEVAPKPITRQDRARRVMLKGAAVIVCVVVLGAGQQLAVHGWRAFVFRAPGVGGTPAQTQAVAAPVGPTLSSRASTRVVQTHVRHHLGGVHHRPAR